MTSKPQPKTISWLEQLSQAETKLAKADKTLGQLIELQKPIVIEPRKDYFFSLCRSIVGQQVSVAAAAAIFGRFEAMTNVDPKTIIEAGEDKLRTIGLSRQKASYIHDLAVHFLGNPEIYNHLDDLDDEAVIKELTSIKGIGTWSAQMFLMFTLGRLDVFAPDDVGLQRAIKLLYGWEELPDKKQLIDLASKWQPYRSVACWHLWKSLNNSPT
jgi:DNA-3-methyladenine glycosylase II